MFLFLSESADSVSRQHNTDNSIAGLHTAKFLNTINMSGLPNYKLILKVSAPIMLMWNIDESMGTLMEQG